VRIPSFLALAILAVGSRGLAIEAPASMQRLLASAAAGDVLDISALSPTTMPALNVSRTWSGGTLVFSDSPEYVPGPGILYADTLAPGPVRMMLYHVNATSEPGNTKQTLKLSVVVEPADPANPPTLTMRRKIIYGASGDYLSVGLHAAYDQVSLPDTPSSRVISAPQLLDTQLETHTIPGSSYEPLLEAVYDFDVADSGLKFTAVALKSTTNTLANYAGLAALPREASSPGVYVHDRGTYTNATEKTIAIANGASYATSLGMTHIRAGGGNRDAMGKDPDAGEGTSVGVDAMLGVASTLRGNYAVQYHFQLKALAPDGRRLAILLNPRGGAIGAAVSVTDALTSAGAFYAPTSGLLTLTTQAALLGRWDPVRTPTIDFTWTPPGATSLPVEFILIPYPEPGDAGGNGVVDLADAVMALRFASGQAAPNSRQLIAADMDGNGAVSLADVAAILRRAAGLR
jgi:hypothetical protein